jgi:hypothetical protein
MISPEGYVDDLKNETYEKILKERDKIIREIRYFEKHREEIMNSEECCISVSPDMVYQWNLECLSLLCTLVSNKFEEEYEL